MKLKLKMVAAAAALASLAGGAHADLTFGTTQNNGSFSLMAFNTVNFNWYIRDLGYLMNDFLPTGITTAVADNNQGSSSGSNPAAVGNKTPDAGLLIDGSIKSNFSDAAFGTWYDAQGANRANDVRWMVGSYDQASSASSGSQRRMIISSKDPAQGFSNRVLDSFVSTSNYGGLFNFFNPGDLSKTGVNMSGQAVTGMNGGLNLDTLGMVGDSQSLFYAVRSAFTGSSDNPATVTAYSNSLGLATMTLEADGDLIYSVSAVPLPPALWMMGVGLVAIGGMVRRRRAAALPA